MSRQWFSYKSARYVEGAGKVGLVRADSQDQLERILFSALQPARLPFALLPLFPAPLTADSSPPLTILHHLQRSKAATPNVQLVPLETHIRLRDISYSQHGGAGRVRKGVEDLLLKVGECRLGCLFRCYISSYGDGEDRSGTERWVTRCRGREK